MLLHMLSLLRNKSLRKKIWFKALNTYERELINLVLRNVKMVRNKQLAIVLARIVVKLMNVIDTIKIKAYIRAYKWVKSLSISREIVLWFIMIEKNK